MNSPRRTVKALSLWQPWASAIALGNKRYETRSWSTNYRGLLLIHAAKKWTRNQQDFATTERAIGRLPAWIPCGCIVAVCQLVAVHRTEEIAAALTGLERLYGDYTPGRYAWQLENIVPLTDPVGFAGHQGIFECDLSDAPKELTEAVEKCSLLNFGDERDNAPIVPYVNDII